ncbi:hypothetical protein JANAI62_31700 [Jannaschia pagri]|uniref:Uncharacterized protein n=1 Tax=Jannaschia pagri TaxID=2829797 RepID=A0ABQ4NQ50_9RHOB|nr:MULTISPECIES: hypothetical protein [unclassified Jannaschia]GIT92593.1 hypothetical protein JANAI61_30510 [Jannaschia sp. AI_61]GIT96547.1 hypothetical protein JANAI62_31700 [Jannaschia sp. AI_62]
MAPVISQNVRLAVLIAAILFGLVLQKQVQGTHHATCDEDCVQYSMLG